MTAVDFEAFVGELARAAGEAVRPFFRTALSMRDKSAGVAFDPVTEADRAAETAMRQMIMETFPAHGIVGEEFPDHQPDAEYRWVLDPIDGTKSFICGFPTWGTLICLEHNGRPAYGMMHQPFTRERFMGDGARASWSGLNPHGTEISHHLRTRPCATMAEATTMTTSPRLMQPAERDRYARVEDAARLSRYGGDCYSYCMLAAGHVDLVIESGLKPYDIAALIPIVTGAGGLVTTWDGGDASQGGQVIAAGDARVHELALALLNG
ncbi:histidinol-phosphatase [Lichenifustis flavocetrariae]|uniref:Histidinol-phosphatase n=1 Tax=Lichenifustis flavocetrariae TaxID=2949735 RepID=A0AA41YTN9_9HYPH|nr:histidinol-phosphatase [Lichenifustis flavocetrariae]MCW6508384.1 histidinol-phosphatase [Lichenifustis flavocetrariae]